MIHHGHWLALIPNHHHIGTDQTSNNPGREVVNVNHGWICSSIYRWYSSQIGLTTVSIIGNGYEPPLAIIFSYHPY